ncbi:DUF1345 domain-containing protein [Kineosporia babensis]|uniref:DUF1345 domain-containing protein n=1 Tax=Kineosporia babensis TaxID=499548 RepID=A0A9X1T3P2_9ACTN|nr:DUF1345 domain-containing protein [Kineosporia babensis]
MVQGSVGSAVGEVGDEEGGRLTPARAPWYSRILDYLFLLATGPALISVALSGEGSRDGELTASTAFTIVFGGVWVVVGLLWSLLRVWRIRKSYKGDSRWHTRFAGRRLNRLILVGTSIIVLDSGMNILVSRHSADEDGSALRWMSMIMVVVAWLMLQLVYTERYARMNLETVQDERHLDFPGRGPVTLLDYAYFAFTVGIAFSTSDVSVQTTRMRGVVLCHTLLAFVYNTAILGMVLGLVTA